MPGCHMYGTRWTPALIPLGSGPPSGRSGSLLTRDNATAIPDQYAVRLSYRHSGASRPAPGTSRPHQFAAGDVPFMVFQIGGWVLATR